MLNIDIIVAEIKKDKKTRKITPRQLFNHFGFERRTPKNQSKVDDFLNKNDLEVYPHYSDVWIDNKIELRHKPVAGRKSKEDPIKRLRALKSATVEPMVVKQDAKLNEATTLMMLHKFSQLPVISSSMRDLCGYISWETIGNAITHGISSDKVSDYMNPIVKTLSLDTPMLKAIYTVHKHEFVIVVDKSKSICGILTTTDISSQYLAITEPFILLEQVENHIRILLDDIFLLEDIKKVCENKTNTKEILGIDDLTFGQYIRLIENSGNWNKLGLNCDKKLFISKLHEIREIRNDIMHFEPAGITKEKYEMLKYTSDFLSTIVNYKEVK